MSRSLIVNPRATRVTEDRVRAVEASLRPVETLFTDQQGHATELAAAAAGDEVWVLGGDGVVNEVLNGLRPDAALGVVPAGHTNVLARAIRAAGGPRRISLGRVNGRRFAFAAGIGVDSDAVRELETIKRRHQGRRPGDLAYARVIAARLWRGYERLLEIDGFGRAAIAVVANHSVFTYVGRFPLQISPSARFELGLDLVAVERVSRLTAGRLISRLAVGRGLPGARGVLAAHDLDRVVLRCDRPLALQADGEDLGDVEEAVFEVERDAVMVLV